MAYAKTRTQHKDRAFELFMTQSSDTESSKHVGSTEDIPRHEFGASEFAALLLYTERWQTTVIRHRSEQTPGLYQRQFAHAFDTDNFSLSIKAFDKAPANATSLISSSVKHFSS